MDRVPAARYDAAIEATAGQPAAFATCPSCGATAELAPGAPCPACGVPAPAAPSASSPGGNAGPAADPVGHPGHAGPAAARASPPSGFATPPTADHNAPPLGSPAASPPAPDTAVGTASAAKARDLGVWIHLSALVALLGIPSPLGPLVLWLANRESHPLVDAQGKEALNFNISALLYAVVLFAGGFIFSFLTLGFGLFLFIPLFFAVLVAWLVAVVVAAVKASKGELFRYPLTIRFVS